MEILNQFLFGDPEVQKAIAPLALAAIAAAPGVIKAVGSMFGSTGRKREERAATAELADRRQAYEQFQFQDPSRNLTNPFEDLTVNQQQSQFLAQQQQQGLAGTLGQLQGAAGSSGIAALAQSLAQQQATNLQASAANIGQQEMQNQLMRARGQQTLEQQRAAGAMEVQQFELGRTETLMDAAAQRKVRATAERTKARQDLVAGVGEAAGGVAQTFIPGIDGSDSLMSQASTKADRLSARFGGVFADDFKSYTDYRNKLGDNALTINQLKKLKI